jgi:hypothetical protein
VKIYKKIRPRRTEGISLFDTGLLAFIARKVGAGIYQESNIYTADSDGSNSTKSAVQRGMRRLILNEYLIEKFPRKWLGREGWSIVGVKISPKGWRILALSTEMGLVSNPDPKTTSSKTDPDPNGSKTILLNKLYVKEIGDNKGINDKGINAGDLTNFVTQLIPPIEWASPVDRAVRQVLDSVEHRREMAELAASHWGRIILPEPVKVIQPEPIIARVEIITPETKTYNAQTGSLIGDAGQPCLSLTDDHCQNKPLAGRQMCQACEDEMVRQAKEYRAAQSGVAQ